MKLKLINDLRASIDCSEEQVLAKAKKDHGLPQNTPAFVYRRSLDTRKDRFSFVYTVAVETEKESANLREVPSYTLPKTDKKGITVPVVGFGPAGMFCAWLLAKCGCKPIVIERGRPVDERLRDVKAFWKGEAINPESNVQFGEGGAGTFSDGKLTTRIHDPRCRSVLETFVQFGAPKEILKSAKPHIGTDNLQKIVKALREEIIKLGGEVLFETKLTDIRIEKGALKQIFLNGEAFDTEIAVLAIGNGAEDTYKMLLRNPLAIEKKPFSVGFRAEHSQDALNHRIYGKYYGNKNLGPADYLFSHVTDKSNGTAVYSFCMCPGGRVVNASSLPERLTTNGMSYFSRDGENANAAILASIHPSSPEEGLALQKQIESAAWQVARGLGPATTGKDFLNKCAPSKLQGPDATFCPGVHPHDINELFPSEISARLREGFAKFQERILGNEPAILTAPETRTSAPLRILRDEQTLQSATCKGLYPCGEGAGYAGGIMSSAVDGLRVAEQILETLR